MNQRMAPSNEAKAFVQPDTLLARVEFRGAKCFAIPSEDGFELCDGSPFEGSSLVELRRTGVRCPASEATLLPPTEPTKVVGIGANYPDDPEAARLTQPSVFVMPPSAVVASGEPIVLPPIFSSAVAEGELAVVVGRRARKVSEADALAHVLGYTIANDISGRDPRQDGITPALRKGSDTFLPLGPFLLLGRGRSFRIETRVNGVVAQHGDTKDLVFGVARCIAYVSQAMTLEPGDVLVTGTPPPKPTIRPGDSVSVHIAGIGMLTNQVVA
jgi:2-keto-4-pentenoate hydratase/2-oxohepta-3-ene-1,7-dioic acid hydratase in catechol pathway